VPDRPGYHHRHRFPTAIIAHAVWLYSRFALSPRDVEELLCERGVVVTYETVRAWVAKFGAAYAAELRKREVSPGRTWHLDEVFTRVGGRQVYLWRAVDEHGQVLDVLVQEHRDTAAAERFFRRLLDRAGGPPEQIVTDSLASDGAAKARLPELATTEHLRVRAATRLNNRVEQSHQPTRRRERVMRRFETVPSAQRFLAAFSGFRNPFRLRRHLLTAGAYRFVRHSRYGIWRELATVATAAWSAREHPGYQSARFARN
jgi:putative transposase